MKSDIATIAFNFPLRRGVRLALLAAMETCWVAALLAYLGALVGQPTLSPIAIMAVYGVALATGTFLPRLSTNWRLLQIVTVAIAAITLLLVIRVELAASTGPFDGTWMVRYVLRLIDVGRGVSGEFLATVTVVFVFIRGLGFAQRPLSVWFAGVQFRLGILAFCAVFVAAGVTNQYDASAGLLPYFGLALATIALSRIDELDDQVSLGPRWTANLLAAVAVVLLASLALIQILTLKFAASLLALLAPIWTLISAVILLIAIPLGIVSGWLVDLIRSWIGERPPMLRALESFAPGENPDTYGAPVDLSHLVWMVTLLKVLVVLAVVVAVGYLLARALNRRMSELERNAYVREAIGPDERDPRDPVASQVARRRTGEGAAESIRRIYAALVATAGRAGLPRREAETPYEFLPRLEQNWPDQASALRAITHAYVAVHYAEATATPEETESVRRAWNETRAEMKSKRGEA